MPRSRVSAAPVGQLMCVDPGVDGLWAAFLPLEHSVMMGVCPSTPNTPCTPCSLAGSPEAAGVPRRGVDEPGGFESIVQDAAERARSHAHVSSARILPAVPAWESAA